MSVSLQCLINSTENGQCTGSSSGGGDIKEINMSLLMLVMCEDGRKVIVLRAAHEFVVVMVVVVNMWLDRNDIIDKKSQMKTR